MGSITYPKPMKLKGGRQVVLRLVQRDDGSRLAAFFAELTDDDRQGLEYDVRDPALIRRWTEEPDLARLVPLVALDGERIVANGTLEQSSRGWLRHVGEIRLVVARQYRKLGLGTVVARELVALSEERGLEKVQVMVFEDSAGPVRMFQCIGFETAAVIRNMAKDLQGRPRNVAIMFNDVTNLGRIMEDWIIDSMIPAYRIPGEGEG